MSILLEPIQLGDFKLKNKIIMAPLTRCRADENRIPTDMMTKHYAQRASVGMIITEATSISPMAIGYPNTPGIWTNEQIQGWKKVVDAVHNEGAIIVLQLWHVGRVSDPIYLDGKTPISASAVKLNGNVRLVRPEKMYVTPREMTIQEIKGTIQDYKQAAINAKLAGFDGVEIHGANGYLLDQFLQDSTNKRTDEYGGSLENRAKLMLEVTDTVCEIWGSGKVGVHIAPRCDTQDMGDSNPIETFSYLVAELGRRNIAFIFSRAKIGDDNLAQILKSQTTTNYIVNQELDQKTAEFLVEKGIADAVSWGQTIIANPDLAHRFANNITLNLPKPEFYYHGGETGYTDYPFAD
ncbi:alkene reductase [Francisellaceae bacterium CB300]|jgi:2,4-dienoyl-CoA reductase-like NADH-dependent reductase (Old Yellow Enzyme family)